MPGEEEPWDSCIVLFRANVVVILRDEEVAKRAFLIDPNLKREPAAWLQLRRSGGDEFANQFVARGPAVECDRRIMPHLGSELRSFARADVGEVGDDQVESAFGWFEKMTLPETDAIGNPEPPGIFARERERVRGKINGVQLRIWKTRGEGERDDAAAGSDIEHAWIFRPGKIAQILDQLLGFGARDEGALVGYENMLGEFNRAEQVLERLALPASPNELPQRRQLGFGEGAFEFKIELNSFLA